jgi:hypothetical protein
MTARVRDIDPVCRYALVSHWRKPLRLFDLRALRWVPHFAWERRLYLWTRSAPPRLRARGELIWPDVTAMSVEPFGMRDRGGRRPGFSSPQIPQGITNP